MGNQETIPAGTIAGNLAFHSFISGSAGEFSGADSEQRSRLARENELENSWGSMHGGVLMTLLDVALASAGRSLDEDCNGALTVEMKVNFIAAATGTMLAEGRAQWAGRSLLFSEGELRSEDGTLLAKATGTFKLLYPKE